MSEMGDLRLEVSRSVLTVLDAISLAQGITRNQLVVRVLTEYTDQRHREASLIAKLLPCNPADAGSDGRIR